ncbi:hypothetical protein ACQ5SO_16495 [Rhodovulum sp. DZ06]|uniref:hypothetical protein n=1 Tax=Rhodovulum sp. DZ06 TaxID=3425126 RepID=UPI003D3575C7
MTMIHVTARPGGLALRASCAGGAGGARAACPGPELHGADAAEGVARALAELPRGAPVTALVHGFRFDPDSPDNDPHAGLFHPADPRGWPAGLGHGAADPRAGLCIAFGWDARGRGAPAAPGLPDVGLRDMDRPDLGLPDPGLPDTGRPHTGLPDTGLPTAEHPRCAPPRPADPAGRIFPPGPAAPDRPGGLRAGLRHLAGAALRAAPDLGFARAWRRAEGAGAQLGALIEAVHDARPDLRVNLLAHSLGARVALHALRAPGAGRAILLGAAVHAEEARRLMPPPRPAGQGGGPEVINVISRRNDLFDLLFEAAAPAGRGGARAALGRAGLGERRADWIDLQLDGPAQEAWLAARGHALGPAPRLLCHWGFYERPGALALWAAMLRGGAAWAPEALRRAGAPETVAPRWAAYAAAARRRPAGDATGAEEDWGDATA